MEPTGMTGDAKARQTKGERQRSTEGEGKGAQMTWTQMETEDMVSDGTHKGSEGQADQRTHGEDPQTEGGKGRTDDR
jgi:hypothetical protein